MLWWDIETGLITWQLPTQSSSIINETYNFKTSKLVSDGNSVFFSNNKNQFYSIDLKTGTTNWINEVNSNVKPILVGNLIFTISNEGYLYLIDKNKGNIVRITDLFLNYKDKKRKNIYPIGFVIGDKNVFLTNSDGKMIIAGIEDGKIIKIEKDLNGIDEESKKGHDYAARVFVVKKTGATPLSNRAMNYVFSSNNDVNTYHQSPFTKKSIDYVLIYILRN